MAKSKKKKKAEKSQTNPPEKGTDQETEKPFDFGGIPQRDLKKNLGCG